MKFLLVVFVSALLTFIEAAPAFNGRSLLQPRGLPIPPSQDPFYTPDAGYESQKLGAILRTRKLNNFFGIIIIPEQIKEVYQYLVRSEDSFGNPNAIVTTLFVPYNADPSKIVSYQAAQDSAYINCAPSYAMQLGASLTTVLTAQVEQILAQAPLNEGYYVVVPDHEGPKSTYVAGLQAAHATLNSLRAVLSTTSTTGLESNARVTLWGYSGGSLPCAWGALIQPAYAPDINLVGAAIGGIIVDIDHIARYNMGKLTAGLVFAAINGLTNEYPELNTFIDETVIPSSLTKFRLPEKTCLIEYIPQFIFAQWTQYISQGVSVLDNPIVKNVTLANNLLNLNQYPKVPLLLYNSVLDEIIPASDTDKWYDRLCAAGVSVDYRQDLLGEHGLEAVAGAGDAFQFIKDRLNGVQASSGCNKNEILTNFFDPDGIEALGEIFVNALLTLLQKPVGPYTWL